MQGPISDAHIEDYLQKKATRFKLLVSRRDWENIFERAWKFDSGTQAFNDFSDNPLSVSHGIMRNRDRIKDWAKVAQTIAVIRKDLGEESKDSILNFLRTKRSSC